MTTAGQHQVVAPRRGDSDLETWGELGPAMKALNERQRAFVHHLVTGKPGYGSLVRAYRAAGYGKNSKPGSGAKNLGKEAHRLSRTERIIVALEEELKKVIRGVGYYEAVAAALNLIRTPAHRDHGRAVMAFVDRLDPAITRHSVDVTHRTIDPDREAVEEIKALRRLGTAREKLLEIYGPNGLDRIEALEAAENAQRAAAAKVIEHSEATNG